MAEKKSIKEEIEKVIKFSPARMRAMLNSVYYFNEDFLINKQQEKLLERTIFAMSQIDRKFFVKDIERAYDDNALPIDANQTISQPSTVARMILLSELEESDDILEVGTGSGWNAALLAFLAYPGGVISIERIASLKEKAEANIRLIKGLLRQKQPEDFIKLSKLEFHAESIFDKKISWNKKYDKIIFTAGISQNQEKEIERVADSLLKKEGILVCPRTSGKMLIIKKDKKIKKFETKEDYIFIPLIQKI